ncbi:T7SS effector LXG polymorphic toxin [Carnobacterium maltaromaticum]|uniref:T7SS effector LXG polymorphic toxin n=1 Tax=Carnobacterium maltaromaticum TaxID=2751 RepID=UPI003AFA7BBA
MTKMDIGEYKHLLDQMKELKLTLGVSFTGTNGTIEEFSGDSKLKGTAWSSTKSYFSVGYTPMLDGLSDIFYTAITTLENFIRAFESEVTTSGVKLDLDHLQDLQRRRDELQREKTNWLHQIAEQASKIPGLGHLFDDYSVLQAEKKVQLMEDFQDFIHRHDSDFSELNGLIEQVLLGLEELGKQRSFNGDKQGYSPINFMNLNWSKNLDSYHEKHGEEVKKIQKKDMENFKNMAEVAAGAAAMESFGANVALANMGPSLYSAGKNYYSAPGVKGGNTGKVKTNGPQKTTIKSVDDLVIGPSFKEGAANHILEGEINPRGKAVGFHSEALPDPIGKVVSGTSSNPNKQGVYTGVVEVNGVLKTSNDGRSSFFPKSWSAQQVIDEINFAYSNKVFDEGSRNTYIGVARDGTVIKMFIDPFGKIISAFPKYP